VFTVLYILRHLIQCKTEAVDHNGYKLRARNLNRFSRNVKLKPSRLVLFGKSWNFNTVELKRLTVVPSSQQPPEGGCWAPYLAVGGLKEAPRAPAREHVTPFKPDGHLPVARGVHSCSPPGALRAHTRNWSHLAEEKSYWAVPVKAPYSHRSTTLRCIF
jgi:hypothetical protein